MKYVLKNASVLLDQSFSQSDLLIEGGVLADISPNIPESSADAVFNLNNCFIFPGLSDVHVHLREPGFSYKETIETGTLAAARGGFTTVCAMPNLSPVPDCMGNLKVELERIEKTAHIRVMPYGAITVGQNGQALAAMEELFPYVAGFSDDGHGVADEALMIKAMKTAARLCTAIVSHCEDISLVNGGYIHDGIYAHAHGHAGISSESEWRAIKRDLTLLKKADCVYHICHVSTKESVALIRQAKREGLNVTAETAPHYLLLDENDLQEDGRFKMNPPLRAAADREALLEGIKDGTIDMIATDHAPHAADEKLRGLKDSIMGVVGLETSFALCYTGLVKTGILTLLELIRLMHDNPNKRFGIGSELKIGGRADLCVFDLGEEYIINSADFLSMGKSTPFLGKKVYGRCKMTMYDGKPVWTEIRERGR